MEQRQALAAPTPAAAPGAGPTREAQGSRRSLTLPALLWCGAALAAAGAGLLLWHARGEAVFFDMLASALALCF